MPYTPPRLEVVCVDAKQRVTVPAGEFNAFKIVVRNKWTNALVRQYWIASKVKNLVRGEEYTDLVACIVESFPPALAQRIADE
jgi:hypothetical protein